MIGIVISKADPASVLIGEALRSLTEFEPIDGGARTDGAVLREFDSLHIELDGVDREFEGCDLLVFASRHRGETGPLLSAHPTGNLGPAEYGGTDGSLARTGPNAIAHALAALDRHAPTSYETGLEGTHHGPSELSTPAIFIELGSGPEQWEDLSGARAVASAILDLRGVEPDTDRAIVGFGGGHYVPRFERIVRETDWAVGHIAVDWALEAMGNPQSNMGVIDELFEQSNASLAVLDDEPALRSAIESLGYRVVSETWLRETDGVAISLVERLESSVCAIEDGLRLGERAPAVFDPASLNRFEIPEQLLAELNGIDREQLRAELEALSVAFTTTDNGATAGQLVVTDEGVDRNELMDLVTRLLHRKYDAVERDDDRLIVHRSAFVPERARELGIPDGPAFGRLANGQAIDLDGETINPEDVRERQTHMFSSVCLSDTRHTSGER
ncbi:D-aminoacyl-tRNA deacylase [Halocatena halophila]|uniref:D-aminoacyl-tRNA deacylase n=1 Tax=Halocatena halophila TaxID=2814576 RepID=UPI002ED4C52E